MTKQEELSLLLNEEKDAFHGTIVKYNDIFGKIIFIDNDFIEIEFCIKTDDGFKREQAFVSFLELLSIKFHDGNDYVSFAECMK